MRILGLSSQIEAQDTAISLRLNSKLLKAFQNQALRDGVSYQAQIRRLMRAYLGL